MSRTIPSSSLCALLAIASLARAQTTWYVDASAPPPGLGTQASPYASLQLAIARPTTASGDTILVLPGTYAGPFDFVGKQITVRSTQGPAATILDGGATWPPPLPPAIDPSPIVSVVTFQSNEGPGAVLDGFTVQHGRGTQGTGTQLQGGGIYVFGASPTLVNLVVRENRATLGAGMYFAASNAFVQGCTIRDNTGDCACVETAGIGVWTSDAIGVDGCTIEDNGGPLFVASKGGGVWASNGAFTSCTIARNRAWWGAGAFLSLSASLDHCTIEDNVSISASGDPGRGAGVFGGNVTSSVLRRNVGAHAGGGAYQSNLVGCELHDNAVLRPSNPSLLPAAGGGAWGGTMDLCDVHHNVAGALGTAQGPATGADGGGVEACNATRTKIHHNTCFALGGANGGAVGFGGGGAAFSTLVDCDVYENEVVPVASSPTPPIAAGGGVYAGVARNTRIFANRAPYAAGAANGRVASCTISANVASVDGGGAGSVYAPAQSMIVDDCVLWHDAPNELTAVGMLAIAYSDVEGGPGGMGGTGNFDADPLFQAPASGDFRLRAASPCIDAGDPMLMDLDGSVLDVGAYAFECGAHVYCTAKTNSLGCTPAIAAIGAASISGPDDFHVACFEVRKNAPAVLAWSRASDALPFGGGTLCLGGSVVLTPVQVAIGTGTGPDCSGVLDFHFSQAYAAAHAIAPLETIFAQWITRDATHADGTRIGLSDALAFTVCP